MTPSGWHDDARNRDAGHDEMQIAVFDYLKEKASTGGSERSYRSEVGFEVPFMRGGQIVAWGDIVEFHYRAGEDNYYRMIIFEIKPKIYSIGAVMRQCVALETTANSIYRTMYPRPTVLSYPVVWCHDPKLASLAHVWRAFAWDGKQITPVRGASLDGESLS